MAEGTNTFDGGMRRARMGDVASMQRIINDAADRGKMLPRALAELYETLRDFVVWEKDGEVVGCCALHVAWADLAEIKSLSVAESVQGKGIGATMVQRCLEDARDLGVRRVFALTYQSAFFKTQGFHPIDKALLPHKIWAECTRCVKFPDCDEQAVQIDLAPGTSKVSSET
jgi:amino-acid N-acetyltransferase